MDVLVLSAIFGSAAGLFIWWRLKKKGAAAAYEPLKRVGYRRRVAIVRTVARGETVSDPRDAALALAAADYLDRADEAIPAGGGKVFGLEVVVLALLIVGALVTGRHGAAAFPALLVAVAAATYALRRRRRARVARSRERTKAMTPQR